ncbi:MAG: hypothetical protein LBL35_04990 [Clostridiales bacterium]|jgi:3-hydroxyacyl-[acyl-carrier-protein] dehydratase|nr:hypothetical protein [Clostridiales bacterium]
MDFNIQKIYQLLPHRAPFLLIDKVVDCTPGISAVGIKNVTIDEPFFNGHFPTEPIFPGALTIESIAQTAAVMLAAKFISQMEKFVAEATVAATAIAEAKARAEAEAKGESEPDEQTKAAAKAKAEKEIKAIVEARMNGINVALPEGFELPEDFKSPAEHVGFLISTNLKFMRPIRPGDTMRIRVKLKGAMGPLTQIDSEVRVGNDLVAKGVIGLSERR